MWNATTRGFFSAVQHRDDTDLLVVRTRDHGDAETLVAWYATWKDDLAVFNGNTQDLLPVPAITTYEWSDYPWRVIMPRTAWGAFLAETVEDLDYGNFKDAVKAQQGADRAQVYSGVWSVLLRLEDLDPKGRRTAPIEDDEPWDSYYDWEARTDEPYVPWEDQGTDPTPAEVSRFLEAQE